MSIQKTKNKSKRYRDKSYIIKDLVLTLVQFGEINQTLLATFCGINITKHKKILTDLEINDLINKREERNGRKITKFYKATIKGYDFCKTVLIPYEHAFPRDSKKVGNEIFDEDLYQKEKGFDQDKRHLRSDHFNY